MGLTAQVTSQPLGAGEFAARSLQYAWNPNTLAYEVVTTAGTGVGEEVKVTNTVAITAASLPLPTGAATSARQDTGNTSLGNIDTAQGAQADVEAAGNGSVIAILKRIRTLLSGTLAVSIAAAVDVSDRAGRLIGVISGTVTANAGTNLNTSALALDATVAKDATLTGGTTKAIVRGGAKGATAAADLTGTAEGADHQALDVQNYHGGVSIDPRDVLDRAARLLGIVANVAELRASTTVNSSTAAVNTALTATLAAAGAGLFHYITSIIVEKLYSVVGVAAGAGVVITSANLGGLAWTTEQLASVAGTVARVVDYRPTTPLKSAVANTNSTVICPVQLQTIWRITVTYFIAA